MFVIVREIVAKCTENQEGVQVSKVCLDGIKKSETVRVSFDGIVNVTEDFIYGFLGTVATANKQYLKQIKYVRIENRIRSKIKVFYQKMGHKTC